ncbi:transcriptional regulator [Streptomyces sp. NPDC059247]|uniref:transcriptional regulator n=1 Tax=Streptomyces sp. NPDC059247 TaxID=3346790 RepID=UPI0036A63FBA
MVSPDGIGELLRSIRERADRSREQQAKRMTAAGLVCTVENLKRWETEKRLPTPVWRTAIRAVYGLTDEQLDQALENTRRHRRQQRMEDDDVKRRKLFTLAAATAGFAVLPGIAQAREDIDTGLDADGAGDLAYLEGAFERHRGGYNGRAPDAVLGEMREDLALLAAVLRRPHPARDRTDLARTAAGISDLVAIVQHDRGDQADAHRWFTTAAKAARESGDRRMTAWVLGRHAMVGLNYGAPGQAAHIAAQARREAGARPSGAAALAAAVNARALAAIGDFPGARRAVDDVRTLAEQLDGPESADTWFGYPAQKHAVHLSQAYTLLGDTRAAYRAQDDALALTFSPSVMTRALIAMDAAACLRVDGDPGEAAEMAAAVYDRLPPAYRTGLVHSRAQLLHRHLNGAPRRLLGDALA